MLLRFFLAFLLAVSAVDVARASTNLPLFETQEVLRFSMEIDFDALCRPSEDPDCDFVTTTLVLQDGQPPDRSVPVEVRRRDGWRAQYTNCQIPTLFVRFSPETSAGTPFEGQDTLALTSHCGKGIAEDSVGSPTLPDEFESYVITEYLGYRFYSLFTDASLQARLARITYVHPTQSRRTITRDAFFAEHFDSLSRRLGVTLLGPGKFDPARLDRDAMDRLALFQYMIGNTDWSVEKQENIFLLRPEAGADIPVLFDLDQSGLVNAHYAKPAPGLPINNVQQRYFLGYCNPDQDWTAMFEQFSEMRGAVLKLLGQAPGLGRGDRRMTGVFLDGFFDTIESAAGQQAIVDHCRPWPPGDLRPGSAP